MTTQKITYEGHESGTVMVGIDWKSDVSAGRLFQRNFCKFRGKEVVDTYSLREIGQPAEETCCSTFTEKDSARRRGPARHTKCFATWAERE